MNSDSGFFGKDSGKDPFETLMSNIFHPITCKCEKCYAAATAAGQAEKNVSGAKASASSKEPKSVPDQFTAFKAALDSSKEYSTFTPEEKNAFLFLVLNECLGMLNLSALGLSIMTKVGAETGALDQLSMVDLLTVTQANIKVYNYLSLWAAADRAASAQAEQAKEKAKDKGKEGQG